MPDASFYPELGTRLEALVRTAYGVLMLATLLQALPEARRFFLSERWGGYAKSTRDVDAVQNPVVMPLFVAAWFLAAAALATGWWSPWPAILNLAFCRYFFIHMRWKGILRGMGAPGFIAYWVGLVVCLFEVTARFAPEVRPLALLVAQVDLACIMLTAGIYKFAAGYPQNHGMELGLCNPMWGYWWRWYIKRRPASPVFWTMNQLAWGTEVVAALLMLVPATREIGGLLILVSFAFIATQIRLGFLCEMVMAGSLIFIPPDGWIAGWFPWIGWIGGAAPAVAGEAGSAGAVLRVALWTYLALLPLAYGGLYYNFYARRRLPALVQRVLERYTNFFGLILWRVFSVDLVNFFIRLSRRTGERLTAIAPLGDLHASGYRGAWSRFNHVGEMICLTSLFTTLKYYPSNDVLFQERLRRYARTLPHEAGETLVFEYVSVVKRDTRFDWVPVGEYQVDPANGAITTRWIDPEFSPHAGHRDSPLHEGDVPGSYVPASR